MKKSVLMFSLLSGTALMFPRLTIASGLPAHTHTYTPEPKPAFQFEQPDKAYKTAGICFLGVGDCDPNVGFDKGDDYYLYDRKRCWKEGYCFQNCSVLEEIDAVCPYKSTFGRGCKCSSKLVSCPAGQVGVGDSCDGKYLSCQCDPKLVSCASNQTGQGASCGGKYESCSCKGEYLYTSANCSYPRSVSGDSCGGKYTGCSCPSGVSSGNYGCEEYYGSPCSGICKKAYGDNCHNRTDNNSALYGCMKYYNDCSTKCETPYKDNCRNRTEVISSCPANAVCSYFSDCSSKISSWSCKSGYTLSGNTCAADGCKIGYIYYTDGKCLPAANHDSGKTVLGIVVHITDGGQHGQIMAPWPIDENGGRLSDNSIRMKWAVPYGDITTLTNYTSQSAATTDRDSCGNTAKITAKDSADKYPAAWATRKYAPTSATSGKWCLPAAGILTNIYNNLSSVQAAIGKVGGVALLSHGGIWSSSEKDSQNAWMLYVPAGSSFYGLGSNNKTGIDYVRPVLEF